MSIINHQPMSIDEFINQPFVKDHVKDHVSPWPLIGIAGIPRHRALQTLQAAWPSVGGGRGRGYGPASHMERNIFLGKTMEKTVDVGFPKMFLHV